MCRVIRRLLSKNDDIALIGSALEQLLNEEYAISGRSHHKYICSISIPSLNSASHDPFGYDECQRYSSIKIGEIVFFTNCISARGEKVLK